MPAIVIAYIEQFEKHYGHNRCKIKNAYKNGEHIGYTVFIDGSGGNVMNHRDMEEAVEQFKK